MLWIEQSVCFRNNENQTKERNGAIAESLVISIYEFYTNQQLHYINTCNNYCVSYGLYFLVFLAYNSDKIQNWVNSACNSILKDLGQNFARAVTGTADGPIKDITKDLNYMGS